LREIAEMTAAVVKIREVRRRQQKKDRAKKSLPRPLNPLAANPAPRRRIEERDRHENKTVCQPNAMEIQV